MTANAVRGKGAGDVPLASALTGTILVCPPRPACRHRGHLPVGHRLDGTCGARGLDPLPPPVRPGSTPRRPLVSLRPGRQSVLVDRGLLGERPLSLREGSRRPRSVPVVFARQGGFWLHCWLGRRHAIGAEEVPCPRVWDDTWRGGLVHHHILSGAAGSLVRVRSPGASHRMEPAGLTWQSQSHAGSVARSSASLLGLVPAACTGSPTIDALPPRAASGTQPASPQTSLLGRCHEPTPNSLARSMPPPSTWRGARFESCVRTMPPSALQRPG
jgi:hypothetical protein